MSEIDLANTGKVTVADKTENDTVNGKQSFRGPLKYSVETSAPQLEAGRNTTVSILVTNPYDISVEIESVQPKVPAHFKDSGKGTFWQRLRQETEEELGLDEDKEAVSRTSSSSDSKNGDTPSTIILQPGNTAIYDFSLRTRQSTWFTPAVHNLNAQVQYKMGGKVNHDTVKYQLNIRAPLKALIYGSVSGAIVGTILRNIKAGRTELHLYPFEGYLPFVVSILVGAVLVIAFARKKDAQPFITIEDFWGGFFIGFLAGYVGDSMLELFTAKYGK